MIIKCPKCVTDYNIPDHKIGDKPRKMRCARCQAVFTISKRGSVPEGYEQFTGEQSALPQEFAFLRQADSPAPSPREPQPAPPPTPSVEPAEDGTKPGVPFPSKPPEEDVVEKALREVEEAKRQRAAEAEAGEVEIELDQSELEAFDESPQAAPAPVAPAPVAPAPVAPAPVAPAPVTPVPAPPPDDTSPSTISEIYGTQSAWEVEAPMDLGSYAVDPPPPAKSQWVGKFMTVVIILIAAFFIFVAYRNGWSLSFGTMGEQIDFAFSGKPPMEVRPREVEELEIVVDSNEILERKGKPNLLLVHGNVFNNGGLPRTHVVLRGRIIDSAGAERGQARLPCGVMVPEKKLRKANEGRISKLFQDGNALYNCVVGSESTTAFQMVFEDVPVGYDQTFKLEVEAVHARVGD